MSWKPIELRNAAAVVALLLVVACGPAPEGESATGESAAEAGAEADAAGGEADAAGGEESAVSPVSPEAPPLPDGAPRVVVETSHGDIVLGLYADRAPVTVDNFLQYVDEGFYAGTTFHRVMPGFMIQGGGLTPDLQRKPTRDPIPNEAVDSGLKNVRGTVAMARRRGPDTATSQFFINLVDNASLDPGAGSPAGYAVFGVVVDGMDVVGRIAQVPTGSRGGRDDVPRQDVMIEEVRRVESPDGS